MNRLWRVALLFSIALAVHAQTTTTTATVVDSAGVVWINAPYTIQLQTPTKPVTNPGNSTFTYQFSGTTNGSGFFTQVLQRVANIYPANTTWQFCVTPGVSASQQFCVNVPVGNAGQSSQDVSSQINAVIRPPVVASGVASQAYADAEVTAVAGAQYYNVTSNTFRCYSTSWATCGGGGGTGASATIENVYATPGAFTFTHGLNTLFYQVNCITRVGAGYGPATVSNYPIDTNNVSVSVPAAGDYICSFSAVTTLAPNFNIAVVPTSQIYEPTMTGTQTPTFAISQTAVGGYTGTASYSTSGLASGMTGAYSPTTITGTGSNTLTLSFPFSQTPATTTFTATGTDGALVHSVSPAITVGNINTGLVECWAGTDGSGSAFADSCGTSNTETLAAGTFTWQSNAGYPGTTALFSATAFTTGTNQTATNFTGATPFSLSAWVTMPTVYTGVKTIFSTVDPAAAFKGWELQLNAFNISGVNQWVPLFYIIANYPTNAMGPQAVSGFVGGTQHFIVITYDGSRSAVTGTLFYVDGIQVASSSTNNTLSVSAANTKPVSLGARVDGTDPVGANSIIAYARIWNRVLSQTDVTNYFNAGAR